MESLHASAALLNLEKSPKIVKLSKQRDCPCPEDLG